MSPYLLALLNLAICCALGWTCLCRLNVMSGSTTLASFRAKYAVLFTAVTASGFGPLWAQWPNLVDVGINAAFLYMLAGGTRAWAHGIPDYATKPGALTHG